jgi:glycosyltransferase involved in cell wall biosynthesis
MMQDVCLLLEGTYPYVAGGVSTWVHELISTLPEFDFSIVHISPSSDTIREYKYPLPDNIKQVEEVFIQEFDPDRQTTSRRKRHRAQQYFVQFLDGIKHGDVSGFEALVRKVLHPDHGLVSVADLMYGKEAWELLVERYQSFPHEVPMIDLFWTWRFSHLPVLNAISQRLPAAAVYHSVSTGYAGLMGAAAKVRSGNPFVLTEHGIYAYEREMEILQAQWISTRDEESVMPEQNIGFFRNWWINIFYMVSKLTYLYSDEIITLFEGNQLRQIADGADPVKCRVIPNGIDIEVFRRLRDTRPPSRAPRIAFVGRVVPIKDVKTFIRAIKIVRDTIPLAEAYIVGPTNEDPEYFAECEQLVEMLDLKPAITFTGMVDVKELYPELDLVVLTSLSEAQPLVILEANCAGIPVVASDVGACREMLMGRTAADAALGPSGAITSTANPAATAGAINDLLQDNEEYLRMSQAGRERVSKFYYRDNIFREYGDIYRAYRDRVLAGGFVQQREVG